MNATVYSINGGIRSFPCTSLLQYSESELQDIVMVYIQLNIPFVGSFLDIGSSDMLPIYPWLRTVKSGTVCPACVGVASALNLRAHAMKGLVELMLFPFDGMLQNCGQHLSRGAFLVLHEEHKDCSDSLLVSSQSNRNDDVRTP